MIRLASARVFVKVRESRSTTTLQPDRASRLKRWAGGVGNRLKAEACITRLRRPANLLPQGLLNRDDLITSSG